MVNPIYAVRTNSETKDYLKNNLKGKKVSLLLQEFVKFHKEYLSGKNNGVFNYYIGGVAL